MLTQIISSIQYGICKKQHIYKQFIKTCKILQTTTLGYNKLEIKSNINKLVVISS